MTNTILSKFDDEMSKPHTDTEDRIHNWLVDNQDDQELMNGLKKNLKPERTINGAMQYAIYKASQMLVGPRQGAMGSIESYYEISYIYDNNTYKEEAPINLPLEIAKFQAQLMQQKYKFLDD